jgi:hypothetical protein
VQQRNAQKAVPAITSPSDAFLNLLAENDIMCGRITAKKALERNASVFRGWTQQRLEATLKNAICGTEVGNHDSVQLSHNGGLTMTPLITCFLREFKVHPDFEGRFISQLYQELRPIAMREDKVIGEKFAFTFHGGRMMAICPFALVDHADLQSAA